MATAVNQAATGNLYIDGLLSGVKWSGTIEFSFPQNTSDYQPGNAETGMSWAPVTFQQRQATRAILTGDTSGTTANVMMLTNVYSFVNAVIQESGGVGLGLNGNGDIRLGEITGPGTAYAYYPNNNANGNGGDVYFGTAYAGTVNDFRNPVLGGYSYHTHIHELGHALGLKHGHETGGPGNVAVPADRDALEFTVMTYRTYIGGPTSGYTYGTYDAPQTFMQYDIQALQAMYGAYYGDNAGNDVYSWSETTGATFLNGVSQGTPGANRVFMTIWDGNGIDTYDMSNFTGDTTINLAPGSWSVTDIGQLANLGSGQQARANVYNAFLSGGDLRSIIENAYGGSGNNTIYGNQVGNTLLGNGGDDTLYGLDGDDLLQGGDNNDYLKGGGGGDHLDGDGGDDTLKGGGGADILHGWGGLDIVDYADAGAAVSVNLAAQTASGDLATGDSLDSIEGVNGSNYDDLVTGSVDANRIYGQDGNDDLSSGGGVDDIQGGDDIDLVRITGAVGAGSNFNGGLGTDRLFIATALADFSSSTLGGFEEIEFQVDGTPKTAVLAASQIGSQIPSNILIDGNITGVKDTLSVVLGAATTVDLSGLVFQDWTIAPGEGDVVQITGSGAADVIIGSVEGDSVNGGNGNDSLVGGADNDVLSGDGGNDTMEGGAGNDSYVVIHAGDVVTEAGADAADRVFAWLSYTLGANVEILSLSGADSINGTGNGLNNIIYGNSAANVINGQSGNDTMQGGAGNDTYYVTAAGDVVIEGAGDTGDRVISYVDHTLAANVENLILAGGAAVNGTGNALNNIITGNAAANILNGDFGNDTMQGAAGDDTYYVTSAGDVVTESLGAGVDRVISYINYTLGANVENLILGGGAAINGTGNVLNNIITGNAAANVLNGDSGNDTMQGAAGDDTYYVTSAGDVVTESAGAGTADRVISYIDYTLGANVEILSLGGAAALNGTGNGLNNTLNGNAGANALNGLAGNDTMNGGAGADYYTFTTALDSATNVDRILGFDVTQDFFRLDDALFVGIGAAGGPMNASAFRAGAGAVALDADDRIIYDSTTGLLSYDFNGNGAGGSTNFALLNAGLGLTAADILVV